MDETRGTSATPQIADRTLWTLRQTPCEMRQCLNPRTKSHAAPHGCDQFLLAHA